MKEKQGLVKTDNKKLILFKYVGDITEYVLEAIASKVLNYKYHEPGKILEIHKDCGDYIYMIIM